MQKPNHFLPSADYCNTVNYMRLSGNSDLENRLGLEPPAPARHLSSTLARAAGFDRLQTTAITDSSLGTASTAGQKSLLKPQSRSAKLHSRWIPAFVLWKFGRQAVGHRPLSIAVDVDYKIAACEIGQDAIPNLGYRHAKNTCSLRRRHAPLPVSCDVVARMNAPAQCIGRRVTDFRSHRSALIVNTEQNSAEFCARWASSRAVGADGSVIRAAQNYKVFALVNRNSCVARKRNACADKMLHAARRRRPFAKSSGARGSECFAQALAKRACKTSFARDRLRSLQSEWMEYHSQIQSL